MGFIYHGVEIMAIHRALVDMVTLPDALASVGFRCIGFPWGIDANPKMETGRVDKKTCLVCKLLTTCTNILFLIIFTFKVFHLLRFLLLKQSSNKLYFVDLISLLMLYLVHVIHCLLLLNTILTQWFIDAGSLPQLE